MAPAIPAPTLTALCIAPPVCPVAEGDTLDDDAVVVKAAVDDCVVCAETVADDVADVAVDDVAVEAEELAVDEHTTALGRLVTP